MQRCRRTKLDRDHGCLRIGSAPCIGGLRRTAPYLSLQGDLRLASHVCCDGCPMRAKTLLGGNGASTKNTCVMHTPIPPHRVACVCSDFKSSIFFYIFLPSTSLLGTNIHHSFSPAYHDVTTPKPEAYLYFAVFVILHDIIIGVCRKAHATFWCACEGGSANGACSVANVVSLVGVFFWGTGPPRKARGMEPGSN
jgi:hypothetical protein